MPDGKRESRILVARALSRLIDMSCFLLFATVVVCLTAKNLDLSEGIELGQIGVLVGAYVGLMTYLDKRRMDAEQKAEGESPP